MTRAWVAVALLALAASACGSDDEEKAEPWCCQVRMHCEPPDAPCGCSSSAIALGREGNEAACQQYMTSIGFCGAADDAAIIRACAK